MTITKTPLRVSLLGGGTDFPAFFRQHGGYVLTTAVNRYVYVIAKERFDEKIRLSYSATELVDRVDDVRHDLVRECLRKAGITGGIELATMADIPSTGSGLGSSSAVTVGLLNALFQYAGKPQDEASLARMACDVEITSLGRPIGVQDQFIAAYGGSRAISWDVDGRAHVDRLVLCDETRRSLNERLLLFYTNQSRSSATILGEQLANIPNQTSELQRLKELARYGRVALESGRLDDFGRCLDDAWQVKRTLASGVTSPAIDGAYEAAKSAGALGGKIAGAGGGGFLLLYCPPESQTAVRSVLGELPEMTFELEDLGSQVLFHQHSRTTWITGEQFQSLDHFQPVGPSRVTAPTRSSRVNAFARGESA